MKKYTDFNLVYGAEIQRLPIHFLEHITDDCLQFDMQATIYEDDNQLFLSVRRDYGMLH